MGSRQKRRKRREKAKLRRLAEQSNQGINGSHGLNTESGEGPADTSQPIDDSLSAERNGERIFSEPRRHRSDARLASRLLSLGVIPEEKAEQLYRYAASGAEICANSGRWSSFNGLMRTLQSAAKLELEAIALAQKGANVGAIAPEQPTRSIDADSVVFIEQPTQEDLRSTAEELANLGILDRLRDEDS